MKRLPLKARKIIKKKKFSFKSPIYDSRYSTGWGAGLDINWRITNISTENEKWDEKQTPYNPNGCKIKVNIKVSGKVQTGDRYSREPAVMKEISKVAEYKLMGNYRNGTNWGGWYTNSYSGIWGYEAHKKIRHEIRRHLKDELKNYLKLFGISNERYWQEIVVDKITWEK
tara:strand:+ start:1548 stop:2057 length:510 start_codon:yes stop_codon:yes gene_type:complete